MQITVNIPDPLYHDLKRISDDVENSVIHALELYATRTKLAQDDPLHHWMQSPVGDREGKSDVAEHHDVYLYGTVK